MPRIVKSVEVTILIKKIGCLCDRIIRDVIRKDNRCGHETGNASEKMYAGRDKGVVFEFLDTCSLHGRSSDWQRGYSHLDSGRNRVLQVESIRNSERYCKYSRSFEGYCSRISLITGGYSASCSEIPFVVQRKVVVRIRACA